MRQPIVIPRRTPATVSGRRPGAPLAPPSCAALLAALSLLLLAVPAAARAVPPSPSLGDYLPAGESYDPSVPTPADVLGFEVGERHVRPDQQMLYFQALAAASDRVTLEVQGRTHEARPLPLLVITSPRHHAHLERVRVAHLAAADPSAPAPGAEALDGLPVVVWLGYSIHGNEASGANASLLVAYHLAAAESEGVSDLLDAAVVLVDPSLNPDGLDRFATWVGAQRGDNPVSDPQNRELNEPWPGGRSNHYWFDLNRDWLLLQQPESRARIATFRRWQPNLVGDYHEMDSDNTFFFQPGVPSRQNPLTPVRNLELTREIAAYHAAALDRAGRLYYTEESFDDFYPGKGSTYPDLTGAVGVLFEQASSRGHRRETARGTLTLSRAVENQFLTSLSMLEAGRDKRRELLAYQRDFFVSALDEAAAGPVHGWVFTAPGDTARSHHLLQILTAHGISAHRLGRPLDAGGRRYEPRWSWVVPADQPQYRLARSIFERATDFTDTTFYDVSAWTLPLAFDMDSAALDERTWSGELLGEAAVAGALPPGRPPSAEPVYAYLMEWTGYYAPRALNRLLAAGWQAGVATRPFDAVTEQGRRRFDFGTVVVPVAEQAGEPEELLTLLTAAAADDGVDVFAVTTGLTPAGVDLGSPNQLPLRRPRPALLVGRGIDGYEAGEVWHLLDHSFGIETTLLDLSLLGSADLGRYTHLLMVDGNYSGLSNEVVAKLRLWVEDGGALVVSQRAAVWVEGALLNEAPAGDGEPTVPHAVRMVRRVLGGEERVAYVDYERERAKQQINGAIFQMEIDRTHPLAFGLLDSTLPVFRNSIRVLQASENPYENVARYTDRPLLAGYASPRRVSELTDTAAVVVTRLDKGVVIRFADDLNFRGVWYGSQKVYLNALFFGPLIHTTLPPSDD